MAEDRKALGLDPSWGAPQLVLALSLLAAHRVAEAGPELVRATASSVPGEAREAWWMLARIHSLQHRAEEGQQAICRYLAFDKEAPVRIAGEPDLAWLRPRLATGAC